MVRTTIKFDLLDSVTLKAVNSYSVDSYNGNFNDGSVQCTMQVVMQLCFVFLKSL